MLYFSCFNSTFPITSIVHELMLFDEAYYIGLDNLSNLALLSKLKECKEGTIKQLPVPTSGIILYKNNQFTYRIIIFFKKKIHK